VISWRRAKGMVFGGAALLAFVLLIWASDHITLQGERTIYTVRCEPDIWDDRRCIGKMVAGDRYAFRSSASRNEVIYWIRGSAVPSGKYSDCTVVDRDNWTCAIVEGQKPSIVSEMKKGRPTRVNDGRVVPFRSVPKWQWWLLRLGVGGFTEASG
jgi:hypothetical protein